MSGLVRASAFHNRAAAASLVNEWTTRGGMTLAHVYRGVEAEVAALRLRAGLIDLSWRWQVLFDGARVEDALGRIATFEPAKLAPGEAVKALWLSDGGGVRGAGLFARHGKERFVLIAAGEDAAWLSQAAGRFGLGFTELPACGVGLAGPYAAAALVRAGLPADLDALRFRKLFWRGLDITLSRFGELGGYELWCKDEDALIVWDRLLRAGAPFGLEPVGMAAADVLEMECGIARPHRDWRPAEDGFAAAPAPGALGLESLIAQANRDYNGRTNFEAAAAGQRFRLAGVRIDSARPAPFTPLIRDGKSVGHTLSSLYSPSLRSAIALARIEAAHCGAGTALTLTLPPNIDVPQLAEAQALVAALPFLAPPAQIAPGE